MKKKLLWLAFFSIIALTGLENAQAVMTDETKAAREEKRAEIKADREEMKNERIENREETREQKCAKIQERIQSRIGGFDAGKEKHMAVYKNMVDRITKFIEKLSAEGYDTSKVKTDLEVLKTKIEKFSTDKEARLSALNATKEFACGKSDGEFKGKLTEARASLQMVHADAMDIRKFMQGTLRPDIQALRKTKMEDKKTTDAAKTGAPELE